MAAVTWMLKTRSCWRPLWRWPPRANPPAWPDGALLLGGANIGNKKLHVVAPDDPTLWAFPRILFDSAQPSPHNHTKVGRGIGYPIRFEGAWYLAYSYPAESWEADYHRVNLYRWYHDEFRRELLHEIELRPGPFRLRMLRHGGALVLAGSLVSVRTAGDSVWTATGGCVRLIDGVWYDMPYMQDPFYVTTGRPLGVRDALVYDGELIIAGHLTQEPWVHHQGTFFETTLARWGVHIWDETEGTFVPLGFRAGGAYEHGPYQESYASALTVYDGELVAGGWWRGWQEHVPDPGGGIGSLAPADTDHIVRWNGLDWERPPYAAWQTDSSTGYEVRLCQGYADRLLVAAAGSFLGSDETPYYGACYWSGSSWVALPFDGKVPAALQYHAGDHVALYAAAEATDPMLCRWDVTEWVRVYDGGDLFVADFWSIPDPVIVPWEV